MSRRKQARPIRVFDSEDGPCPAGDSDQITNGVVNDCLVESDDEEGASSIASTEATFRSLSTSTPVPYQVSKTLSSSSSTFPGNGHQLLSGKLLAPTVAKEVDEGEEEEEEEEAEAEEELEEEDERIAVTAEVNERFSSPSPSRTDETDEERNPDEDEEEGQQRENRKQKQDAENNNNADEDDQNEAEYDDERNVNGESDGAINSDSEQTADCELPAATDTVSRFPFPAASHVTLEALQNTKVAVAQFAATALANNTDNPTALQELAVVQCALYRLHHYQMLQLNKIQQLEQQLQITGRTDTNLSSLDDQQQQQPSSPLPLGDGRNSPLPLVMPKSLSPSAATLSRTSPSSPIRRCSVIKREITSRPASPMPAATQPVPASNQIPPKPILSADSCSAESSIANSHVHQNQAILPSCSISSSFASSIITNLDPPPSPSEPNTLEMLQKRAQEVLDSASQGLLANNLADELAFRKNGSGGKNSLSPYDSKSGGRNEPFFKHRCRYCGKVFGSDSALQIHIRSHTGERPFKCNVCGSRFTTKGNLKVHFQRHTSKFPHIKMNPNPVPEHLDKYHPPLLAQMNAHQSLIPPPPPPPSAAQSAAPHHPMISSHAHLGGAATGTPSSALTPTSVQHSLDSSSFPLPLYRPSLHHPATVAAAAAAAATSLPAFPSTSVAPHDLSVHTQHRTTHEAALLKPILAYPRFAATYQEQPENLCKSISSTYSPPLRPPSTSRASSSTAGVEDNDRTAYKYSDDDETDPFDEDEPMTAPCDYSSSGSSMTDEKQRVKEEDELDEDAADVVDMRSTSSPYGNCSSVISRYSDDDSSSMLKNEDGRQHRMHRTLFQQASPQQDQPENLSNKTVRGNTTCNICYKTFACNSALEIHYRSHTKERPFKCTVCDRGFSTKGNMKQHMLTHKIRDVPPHLFEKTSPSSVSGGATSGCSLIDETSNTSNDSRDLPTTSSQQLALRCVSIESLTSQKNNNMASLATSSVTATANIATASSTAGRTSGSPVTPPTTSGTNAVSIGATAAPLSLPLALIPEAPLITSNAVITAPQKRSPDVESVLPVPKRQSSAPKHLCHVCNKNFSSSSALQIHMRTHTGDKPFRCTVCLKAFTTKGNLKVHMGTHMWTNGASRRGRRMSLELPPLPIAGKETQSDLFHRRPDLFYPYLPTPFLNGVHQKLNEISSLQTATSTMTNGFFPFGGYGNLPLELKRSSSPISEKFMNTPLPSLRHMAALEVDGNHPVLPPWDLHFERKSVDDHQDRCTPSPPRQSTQRGEGLAA